MAIGVGILVIVAYFIGFVLGRKSKKDESSIEEKIKYES